MTPAHSRADAAQLRLAVAVERLEILFGDSPARNGPACRPAVNMGQ